MYVRVTTFDVNPGYKKNATAFAEIFQRRLERYEGFISLEYLYNPENRVGKSVERWESETFGTKALKDFSPSLESAAHGVGSGVFSSRTYNLQNAAA